MLRKVNRLRGAVMTTDVKYHMQRARSERDLAYQSANAESSDAHMRLSALHLERALLLQGARRASVGNVTPFQPNQGAAELSGSNVLFPLIELKSSSSYAIIASEDPGPKK